MARFGSGWWLKGRFSPAITQAGAGGGAEAAIFFEAMAIGHEEDADVAACRFAQALPLTETTGLVFFSQKNVNYTGGAENGQRLCVRDYTIDFEAETVTFSATRVIEQPALWTSGKGWVTEPFGLVLTQGPNAGRIILMNNRDDGVSQTPVDRVLNIYSRYSDDDGQTWSSPALCVANDGNHLASAGQLLELPSGRLVYAVWKTSVSPQGHGALLSDDHGATWARSTTFATDTSEAWTEPTMFRASDGTLYQFVRSDSDDTELERAVFISVDDGDNWTFDRVSADAALKNSNTACLNDGGYLMMGSTANPAYYQRVKYRMLFSSDDGDTFPTSWAPFDDKLGAGYSYLSKLRDNTYLLSYETFSPKDNSTPDADINSKNCGHLLVFNRAAVNAAEPERPAPEDSAATLYAAYAARVVSDGGAVTDPAACEAAIQAAIDGGYWLDSGYAISANWGVKLSGTTITKLYNLVGTNDATPTGLLPIDTATYAWACMNFSSTAYYVLTPSISIDDGENPYAICVSGAGPTGTNFTVSVEGASATTTPLYLRLRLAGQTLAGVVGLRDTGENSDAAHNIVSPAANSGNCAFVETKSSRYSHILNGTTQQIQIAGAAIFSGLTRKLMINGLMTTGADRSGAATGRVNELWHLRFATRTTAKQLATDQGARYA